jgi:hypothetical protein
MANEKIMDPSEPLDYRLGGETWDSWALKYMATMPYIFRVLNALNGTDDTGVVLPTPSGAGAIVRKNANGSVTINVVGNASTADSLAMPRNISLSGDAQGSASFDGSGDVAISVSNVIGNARAIVGKTVDYTNISDGTILVYRASEQKFVFETKGAVGAGKTLTISNGSDVLGTYSGDITTNVDIGPAISAAVPQTATSAASLQTPRSINGTPFDGTENIVTSRWGTSRNITISDADDTNSGVAAEVNGGSSVTLHLPSTIKASVTGNVTGNAATATKVNGKTILTVNSFSNGVLSLSTFS